jgi:hypothetical protein
LHTVFAADAHLPGEKVLREEPTINKGKFLKFRMGMRISTVSSKEGQHLKPLLILTGKITSKWWLLVHKVWEFS